MEKITDFICVIIGCILTAISFGMFIIPSGFACGGITGLAVLVQKLVPFSLPMVVSMLNIMLFIAGWICLGRDFIIKTSLTCILFPIALDYAQAVPILPGEILHPLLTSIIGGMLLGGGTALVIKGNGSCCGFDTVALILHKKMRIPFAFTMNAFSAAVILLQIRSLMPALLGILTILITTAVIDILMKKPEKTPELLSESS